MKEFVGEARVLRKQGESLFKQEYSPWFSGKESARQEMQAQSLAGEDPQRRKQLPTPVLLPGESHGQRSLMGYSPWGHKESDRTEAMEPKSTPSEGELADSEELLPWAALASRLWRAYK